MSETSSGESPGHTSETNSPDPSNLIVNYIPQSITEDGLRAMFEVYGQVERCKLLVDRKDGHSLGYGFVKFDKADDAAQAIAHLNGISWRASARCFSLLLSVF